MVEKFAWRFLLPKQPKYFKDVIRIQESFGPEIGLGLGLLAPNNGGKYPNPMLVADKKPGLDKSAAEYSKKEEKK